MGGLWPPRRLANVGLPLPLPTLFFRGLLLRLRGDRRRGEEIDPRGDDGNGSF